MMDAIHAARDFDERVLMVRIAQADVAAFESIYHCYAERVRGFLGRLLPRRSLVDEVLNDTMLVVWRRAARYDATCRLSTWVFAIAQRQALRALRRTCNAGARIETANTSSGTHPEPETEAQLSQLRERLSGALTTLSIEQRVVIQLTYFEGYDCREIATLMACPVDTVKTRMFHARRKLRRLLSGNRAVAQRPLHRRMIASAIAGGDTLLH